MKGGVKFKMGNIPFVKDTGHGSTCSIDDKKEHKLLRIPKKEFIDGEKVYDEYLDEAVPYYVNDELHKFSFKKMSKYFYVCKKGARLGSKFVSTTLPTNNKNNDVSQQYFVKPVQKKCNSTYCYRRISTFKSHFQSKF